MRNDFGWALEQIHNGLRVYRDAWTHECNVVNVFLVPGSEFAVNRQPLLGIFKEGTKVKYKAHIDAIYNDGTVGVWTPSSLDLLAEDWYIVGE